MCCAVVFSSASVCAVFLRVRLCLCFHEGDASGMRQAGQSVAGWVLLFWRCSALVVVIKKLCFDGTKEIMLYSSNVCIFYSNRTSILSDGWFRFQREIFVLGEERRVYVGTN